MSILLLAIVMIGFARTLFLRPLFQVPAIPWYVYVHGSVMTMWFVLLVAQTSLVAAHRTDVHRRLGILGAVLAVAVVVLGLAITLMAPGHFKAGYSSTGGPPLTSLPGAIRALWSNIGGLAFFLILVTTAVCMRRRPDVHKRLMLLSSVTVIGPALGRITEFPYLSGITSSAPVISALLKIVPVAVILLLPLTLVGHDLLTARRLHPATLWGVVSSFAVGIGFQLVVPATAVGYALWNALE